MPMVRQKYTFCPHLMLDINCDLAIIEPYFISKLGYTIRILL